MCQAISAGELEASNDVEQEIAWRHRGTLEDRLRKLNDAQDRLMDGGYGSCVECGGGIGIKRLVADPAALTCMDCQQRAEGEMLCRTL
jgi:DnaK suppressor protein